MLYAERHRPRCVGLAGAVHRTWAVAEKNDWQFSNPRIDTDLMPRESMRDNNVEDAIIIIMLSLIPNLFCDGYKITV